MFVAVTALVKHLGDRVPAAESAFLRYVLGLVFLIPMIRPILRQRLTRRQLALFGFRGVAHTIGVVLWFYAMTQIPIAEVTAMNYLNPVYVTIGAALFLGEKLALRRILAIGVALVGALIILRPGFREISPGHIAMLGTAVFFALGYLTAKILSEEVPAMVVVGMLSITVTIGLAPAAAMVWVTPTLSDLGIPLCRGLFRHRRALHDDACLRCSPCRGDAAGHVSTACLGRPDGLAGLCRRTRHLGDCRRIADHRSDQLHGVARSGRQAPSNHATG